MRGLLLKDWYMMRKYCRAYLLIAVVFIAVSLVSNDNLFFMFYPCILCGTIPVTLLGYDERSNWIIYSGTMPYTKAQIVSAKYLIGLFTQGAMLLAIGIVYGIKISVSGEFILSNFMAIMLVMFIVSTLSSSMPLPFIFKSGAEKGRIAYYAMIGFVCSASVLASILLRENQQTEIQPNTLLIVLAAVGAGIYILSWYMSVAFYKRREMPQA